MRDWSIVPCPRNHYSWFTWDPMGHCSVKNKFVWRPTVTGSDVYFDAEGRIRTARSLIAFLEWYDRFSRVKVQMDEKIYGGGIDIFDFFCVNFSKLLRLWRSNDFPLCAVYSDCNYLFCYLHELQIIYCIGGEIQFSFWVNLFTRKHCFLNFLMPPKW